MKEVAGKPTVWLPNRRKSDATYRTEVARCLEETQTVVNGNEDQYLSVQQGGLKFLS